VLQIEGVEQHPEAQSGEQGRRVENRGGEGGPATGDPRVHLKPRRHRRGSIVVPLTQYPGRVQVFKQILAPRQPKLVTHTGYEWLYVLAGAFRLIIGEREFTLGPGQVAEFDTSEPHWFGPADTNAVEILHLFGPHGDRAFIRTAL
jgi:mannose-6-phosphate isomerase-like protein (cupin superfamily)